MGAAQPQPERGADGEPEAVSERSRPDLDAGHERAVGVVAEDRVRSAEVAQVGGGEETLRGEDGVVGHRTVALGE